MQRKAIFLDIDGTYTSGSPVPPARNVRAVEAAQAAGHLVFLNTGRSCAFIPEEVLDSVPFDGIVAGNGSFVKLGEDILFRRRVPTETLVEVADVLLRDGVPCMFEGEAENLYLNDQNPQNGWLPVERGEDFLTRYKGIAVTKLTVFGPVSAALKKALTRDMRLITFPRYSETVLKGCSKATGMRVVLKAVGIPPEDSVAMGDSLNDLEMIKEAGFGVAMGGAVEEIKRLADAVVCPAADGGVGEAIERYILASGK
ncbi:MAG: HAD family hydrolase [Candidatus Howiella sp.]